MRVSGIRRAHLDGASRRPRFFEEALLLVQIVCHRNDREKNHERAGQRDDALPRREPADRATLRAVQALAQQRETRHGDRKPRQIESQFHDSIILSLEMDKRNFSYGKGNATLVPCLYPRGSIL